MHNTLEKQLDCTKEEVYITHVYVEQPVPGQFIPLDWISESKGKQYDGLDRTAELTADEIKELLENCVIASLEQKVRLTNNLRPYVREGKHDLTLPEHCIAEVYLLERVDVKEIEGKKPVLTYKITELS
ncbi:MAG: hypothetical protein V1743_03055 [Nanoarchaeota archaeon]